MVGEVNSLSGIRALQSIQTKSELAGREPDPLRPSESLGPVDDVQGLRIELQPPQPLIQDSEINRFFTNNNSLDQVSDISQDIEASILEGDAIDAAEEEETVSSLEFQQAVEAFERIEALAKQPEPEVEIAAGEIVGGDVIAAATSVFEPVNIVV